MPFSYGRKRNHVYSRVAKFRDVFGRKERLGKAFALRLEFRHVQSPCTVAMYSRRDTLTTQIFPSSSRSVVLITRQPPDVWEFSDCHKTRQGNVLAAHVCLWVRMSGFC